MTTQLAFSIEPKAPLVSEPSIRLYICPVRDKCMIRKQVVENRETKLVWVSYEEAGKPCGFEQAGSVMACQKYKRMEGE